MFRASNLTRLTPAITFSFFEERSKYDRDSLLVKPVNIHKTGTERLKEMFSPNEYGEHSIELHNVVQASLGGAFIGACMGGFVQSREAYLYFIENNQATIFKSTMQAKKKLQDHVVIAFAKGAYHWSWRLSLFTGIFSLISTTIAVYRDKTSVIEYTTAGFFTGAIYRANLGLAASCVSAGLGAVLGTIGGTAIYTLLKISGVSMSDLRAVLYRLKEGREEVYSDAVDKHSEFKKDDLLQHHESVLKKKGINEISDIK